MLKLFTRLWSKLATRSISYEQGVLYGLVNQTSSSGVAVNADNALTNSPVFAACRVISTGVGSLPLCVHRRLPNGDKERATDHPIYNLLHDEPNAETDPMNFWAAFVVQMLLHGNGFAEIERAGDGSPIGLWLIPSYQVTVHRDNLGQLFYAVESKSRSPVVLLPEDMFHVPYFSLDGLNGQGVIDYARNAIGLNMAMEEGAGAMFANMVRPSGVLEAPPGLSPEARKNIRESVKEQNSGRRKVGRLLFLEDGVKFNPYEVSGSDAQWIEGRSFGIQEVARFFNISPTKLADLGRATWSNIESENISFIENTLRPVLIPIEQQAKRKLISREERKTLYVEAIMEARLRGLTADRYNAYSVGINAGFMLPSEARRLENMPAIPGIDDRPRPGSAVPSTPTPTENANANGNQDPAGTAAA